MLQDVRDTCVVLRNGRKEDRERVVVVAALDVDVAGAGAFVHELQVRTVELFEGFATPDGVSAEGFNAAFRCLCHERLSLGCEG